MSQGKLIGVAVGAALVVLGLGLYGIVQYTRPKPTPPPAPPAARVIHELPKLVEGQVYDLALTYASAFALDSGRPVAGRTFVRADERTCTVPASTVVYDPSLRLNTMQVTRDAVPAVTVSGTVYRDGYEQLRLHYRVARNATVYDRKVVAPHLKVTSCW